MKQFHFTYCQQGGSVNGRGGWQMRAVSPGLDETSIKPYVRFIDYQKPEQASATDAPRRLALCTVQLPNGKRERLLAHSVFVGTEAGRMQDAFFSHAVLDLPDDFDGLDAIKRWGSGFWVEADRPGPIHLPEMSTILPGTLSAESTSRFLSDPVTRGWVESCLQAVLLITERKPQSGQVFVVAPSAIIASMVHAIGLCLPPSLRPLLTFSTYERKPTDASNLLVGTVLSSGEADLPVKCYTGTNCALNTATGRSNLPAPGVYARQVMGLLATLDGPVNLCKFFEKIETITFKGTEDLDTLTRYLTSPPNALSRDDIMGILKRPLVAQHGFTGDTGAALVKRVVTEVCTAPGEFKIESLVQFRALCRDSRSPSVAKALQDEVHLLACRALKEGNVALATFCAEEVLPNLGHIKTADNWKTFFEKLADEQNLPLSSRVKLLAGAAGADWGKEGEASFRTIGCQWIEVATSDLPHILDAHLGGVFVVHSLSTCLRREWQMTAGTGGLPAEVERFLAAPTSSELLTRIFLVSMLDDSGFYLKALLNGAHNHETCADVIVTSLSGEGKVNPENVELVIDTLTQHKHNLAERTQLLCSLLTFKNFQKALESCRVSSSLEVYISSVVKELDVNSLLSPQTQDLLTKLQPHCDSSMDSDARKRYEAMAWVSHFIGSPVADAARLRSMGAYYQSLSIPKNSEVASNVILALAQCASADNLNTILTEMPGFLANQPAEFFALFTVAVIKQRKDVAKLGDVIYGIVRESCEKQFSSPDLYKYIEQDPEVFSATCCHFIQERADKAALFIEKFMGKTRCNSKIMLIMRSVPDLPAGIIDILLLKAEDGFDCSELCYLKNLEQTERAHKMLSAWVKAFPADCGELTKAKVAISELKTRPLSLNPEARERLQLLISILDFLEADPSRSQGTFFIAFAQMHHEKDQQAFLHSLLSLRGQKERCEKLILQCYVDARTSPAAVPVSALFGVAEAICARLTPEKKSAMETELHLFTDLPGHDERSRRWNDLFRTEENGARIGMWMVRILVIAIVASLVVLIMINFHELRKMPGRIQSRLRQVTHSEGKSELGGAVRKPANSQGASSTNR